MFYILVLYVAIYFFVTLHEVGHLVPAKMMKMAVIKFEVGVGMPIISCQIRNTTYVFRILPLGGFVELKDKNEITKEEFSYEEATLSQQFWVSAGGPIMNICSALMVSFFLYITNTHPMIIVMMMTFMFVLTLLGFLPLSDDGIEMMEINKRKKQKLRENL